MSEHDEGWAGYYRLQHGREPRELFGIGLSLLALPESSPSPPFAVDLGSGDGTETLELLRGGWRALAIDREPSAIEDLVRRTPAQHSDRLETAVATFETVRLRPAHLVYAGFSLPFCRPDAFPRLWRQVERALPPGGGFIGQLFGPNDDWAKNPDMTFHSRDQVQALFSSFHVLHLEEEDRDGTSFDGPKHWHIFHVVASTR